MNASAGESGSCLALQSHGNRQVCTAILATAVLACGGDVTHPITRQLFPGYDLCAWVEQAGSLSNVQNQRVALSAIQVKVDSPFGFALPLDGGTPPYAFALLGGALPPGLSLGASTGIVSGTPTGATAGNTYMFTVLVTDGEANTSLGYYTISCF